MKWLAALGGLLIGGMVFSPAVGLVLGILGAVFVPNSFRREREPGEASSATPARSLQHPFALPRGTAEAEPEEALAELREQVLRLERRLARVEHDLAQLIRLTAWLAQRSTMRKGGSTGNRNIAVCADITNSFHFKARIFMNYNPIFF